MQIRQGDVFLELIDETPVGTEIERDAGRIVLAYGEATGHAHAIESDAATLFQGLTEGEKEARFLRVFKPVFLRHEEHARIELKPGLYRVRRQIEWTDADEPRVVAD